MTKLYKTFIAYFLVLIIIGLRGGAVIAFLTIVAHEGVHFIIARKLGFSRSHVKLFPIGARLELEDLEDASPKEDLIISISGPVFNIVLASFLFILEEFGFLRGLDYIIKINFVIGFFNLIPAFPLDGGRILRDILSMNTIYKRANIITIKVSIIIGGVFFIGSIVLMFLGVVNLNLGIIGLVIIFVSYKERERIVYIIMSDIVKKQSKFLKKKFIENKSISVHHMSELISLVSLIDRNKYSIFIILDDDMKVLDAVYEEEILKYLKTEGNITVSSLLKLRG